jgi:hypothetical protein
MSDSTPCRLGAALLLVLFFLGPGCSPSGGKVSSTLAEAEAELEKSGSALKELQGKPPAEALEELSKIYDAHTKMLGRLSGLEKERFTREEKARFERVLERCRERSAQMDEAKREIRKRLKQQGKD